MARNVTVGSLVTQIRQRADVENFPSPTTSEVKGLLSTSYAWLWGILVRSGLSFAESSEDWTTDGLTNSHALPDDFYAKLRVDRVVSSTQLAPVADIDIREIHRYGGILPSGLVYRLTYVPAAADLSAADDSVEVDGINGFEEMVVLDAALKIRRKEDPTSGNGLERDLGRYMARIEESVHDRELGSVGRVLCREDDYPDYPFADYAMAGAAAAHRVVGANVVLYLAGFNG